VFGEGDSLLRVGVVMMALALALVIAAIVVSVALRGGDPEQVVASEVAAKSFQKEPQRYSSTEEELAQQHYGDSSSSYRATAQREEPQAVGKQEAEPPKSQSAKPQAAGQQTPSEAPSELPAAEGDSWPKPTQKEIQNANGPRHYGLTPGAIMGLTIEAIGIHDAPVFDSDGQWALSNGVAHDPETSLPWSPTPQRNVFLAGHRMGFRGTWSRMIFYNLDELALGERVVLKDRSGRSYEYEVSEVFLVNPEDVWVMGQVTGRDMVTLQTCTPIPTFEKRLIVRADRV
jgi:sortase A